MQNFEWYQLVPLVISGLLSVIGIILWYIMRSIIFEVRSLQKEVSQNKLDVVTYYARSEDVKETQNKLVVSIEQLQNTINNLALTVATLSASLHKKIAKQ